MHSALLLWSLLAVIPFISATPTHSGPALRDWPDFVLNVPLPDGKDFVVNGCHELGGTGGLRNKMPLDNANDLTVKVCIATCHANNYSQGGVGNNTCSCDSNADAGTEIGKLSCQGLTCLGNRGEFCGSSTSFILYSLKNP